MSCTIEQWTATASGTGAERVIAVRGEGTCSNSGCTLRLEPTNEGIIDDPDVYALALIVEEPEIVQPVETPVTVEKEIKGDPATKVVIRSEAGSTVVEVSEG